MCVVLFLLLSYCPLCCDGDVISNVRKLTSFMVYNAFLTLEPTDEELMVNTTLCGYKRKLMCWMVRVNGVEQRCLLDGESMIDSIEFQWQKYFVNMCVWETATNITMISSQFLQRKKNQI